MSNSVLHVAVIGLGRMGRIYARTIAGDVEGAALYAAVDPGARAGEGALSGLKVPHVLRNFEDALALRDLDAVVIATPTSAHREQVIAAARAGKAIFCEKPLALTLAETEEALQAVEDAGVPLQVGFMRRFDASYREAWAAITAGKVGRPISIRSIGRDPHCPNPEFADPAHSGGLILDMGIHDFDVARWLMGHDVERVSAEGSLRVCEGLRAVGDIDNAMINLRFVNGALGQVEVSRNAFYGYDIRTEVLGTEGRIQIGRQAGSSGFLLTKVNGDADHADFLMDRFGEAYRRQLHHFVASVRQGREPAVTGADALAAFEIGLAATQSARSGEPVAVEAVQRTNGIDTRIT